MKKNIFNTALFILTATVFFSCGTTSGGKTERPSLDAPATEIKEIIPESVPEVKTEQKDLTEEKETSSSEFSEPEKPEEKISENINTEESKENPENSVSNEMEDDGVEDVFSSEENDSENSEPFSEETENSESIETESETENYENTETENLEGITVIEGLSPIIEPEVFEVEITPSAEPEIEIVPEVKIPSEPVEPEELESLDQLTADDFSDEPLNIETLEPVPEEVIVTPSKNEPDYKVSEKELESVLDISLDIEEKYSDDVEDISEDSSEINEPEEEKIEIIPSRSVTLKNGESLDVEYPGKGWIFLGSTDGTKKLTSSGRKLGSQNTQFTLLARTPGTTILHFYKEDILAGVYIDDYLEVTVQEKKSKSSVHVKAPAYVEFVPKKDVKKETEKTVTEDKVETPKKEELPSKSVSIEKPVKTQPEKKHEPVKVTPEKIEPVFAETQEPAVPLKTEKTVIDFPKEESKPSLDFSNPSELLDKARKAMDNGKYAEACNNLQAFLSVSDSNRDEALFMLGQIFETNSDFKDVKKAIDAYGQLQDNYPASPYWEEANKRVIYLQRFYIKIR